MTFQALALSQSEPTAFLYKLTPFTHLLRIVDKVEWGLENVATFDSPWKETQKELNEYLTSRYTWMKSKWSITAVDTKVCLKKKQNPLITNCILKPRREKDNVKFSNVKSGHLEMQAADWRREVLGYM